jgi:hypothetical protein
LLAESPASEKIEWQRRDLSAVHAVYEAFEADPGVGKMIPRNLRK